MIPVLAAAAAPFVLWPIELLLPFPYIIEELVKALIVFFIAKEAIDRPLQIVLIILSGLLFTVSETILYSLNISLVGNWVTLADRLLLTGALHIGTLLLILGFTFIKKRLLPVGVILAMIVHFLFNYFV